MRKQRRFHYQRYIMAKCIRFERLSSGEWVELSERIGVARRPFSMQWNLP